MFLLETVNLNSLNTGLQSNLKSGSFVSFSVKKQLKQDLFLIYLSGKSVRVKSATKLYPGEIYKARVDWIKNRLQLKVVIPGNKNMGAITADRQFFSDQITKVITEGLFLSGMPLDPLNIDKLYSFFKNSKNIDKKYLRLVILMLDKGIPLTEENIKQLEDLLNGYSGKDDNSRNRRSFYEENKKDEKKAIIEDLKKHITKIDMNSDLLKYFNHRIADHDNWIIIPVNYKFQRKVKGVLKLHLDKNYKILDLILSLDDGNQWDFIINGKTETKKLNIFFNGKTDWEKNNAFTDLIEKLYKKDIFFDDINNEAGNFDGFFQYGLKPLKGVDFTV